MYKNMYAKFEPEAWQVYMYINTTEINAMQHCIILHQNLFHKKTHASRVPPDECTLIS